jgi:hypothetical protein
LPETPHENGIVPAGARKPSQCSSNSAPFLDNTQHIRHLDYPYRVTLRLLTDVQWSPCNPGAAPAKPVFIDQLIDTVQSLSHNQQRAAAKPSETERINIQPETADQ